MKILICILMAVLVACGSVPTPDTTAPNTPQSFKATAGNSKVKLEWTANTESDLEQYVLLWGSSAAEQNATEIIPKTQTSFELKGLTNGTAYYFKLEARDTTGNTSSGTNVLSATPFAPDTTMPRIISSIPELNVNGVALDTQVQLSFSKAMNIASLTTSSSNLELGTPTWSAGNTVVSFVTPPLQNDKTYTILISAKDTAGNNLAGATTLQFSSVAAAPTVTGSTPANNAINVSINSKIVLQFSKSMNKTSVETAFSSTPNVVCSWLWTNNDQTATCTPNTSLTLQTKYNIGLSRLAKSKTGEPLENPYALSFTTVQDKVKPALVSFTPTDNQKNTPYNTAIVLNFSKPMNRASVESAFQSNPNIVCNWTWASDSSANCQPVTPTANLGQAVEYIITVASQATDLAGNTLQTAYGFRFTTGNAPPLIHLVDPESEAVNVNRYSSITIVFSESMNRIATEGAFDVLSSEILVSRDTIIPGTITWNPECTSSGQCTVMAFKPNNPYPAFSYIFPRFSISATDVSGTPIENAFIVYPFRTSPF
jgi:methionine-rich copper-binding protein CopC